ncbi:MAG: hypothetical protein RL380_1666 [Verrucomicrobiota bacterium]|jgi:hypothetical protein
MPRSPHLLTLQREFMRALREPLHGDSRRPTPLPRRAGKNSPSFSRTARQWLTPSATLTPHERLELYHRQYWYRLLDSLAEDFPALREWLGERRFWRLIEAYLSATPSRSYTLRHLGQGLEKFLKQQPALAGAHPPTAADLARLEYAVCENFEAAEHEPVPVARLATARLALQPHLCLLPLSTAADELWRRQLPGKKIIRPARSLAANTRRYVAVFRAASGTRVVRIAPGAVRLLRAIARTGSLARAFKTARLGSDAATLAQVQSWFQDWCSHGWLCALGDRAERQARRRDRTASVGDARQLGRAEKSNITRLKF